ncbi:MAG: hypothetical protein ACYDAY_00280 [Candidatus Dormibacteria bacterium]
MQRVTVQFTDDEVLVGMAEVDLDRPEFWLEVEDDVFNNNRRALVPLSGVKSVLLDSTEEAVDTAQPKVALRFQDGEVLRGYLLGDPEQRTYGVVVTLVSEDGLHGERLGIPYQALKAIFYLKDWDGRPPDERDGPSHKYLSDRLKAPLMGILTEMDMLNRLRESGVIDEGEFERKRLVLLERI